MKKNYYMKKLEDFDREQQEAAEEAEDAAVSSPLTPEKKARVDRESEDAINREIKHIGIGCLCCSVLTAGVFIAAGKFEAPVVWGLLIGCALTMVSFIYLGRSVQAAVDMGERGAVYLRRTYMTRILINCAAVVLAVKLPFVNPLAGVLPLFFPRVTIFAMQLLGMYRPE